MIIFYCLAAFKVFMLVDAMKRRVHQQWYYIILLPLGDWAYFVVYQLPELSARLRGKIRPRRDSLEKLAYLAQFAPSAENRLKLAEALFDAGLIQQSREEFSAVLKTHPQEPRALYGVALSAKAAGDLELAAGYFAQLLEVSPAHDDNAAVLELVDTYKLQSQADEALRVLQLLVKKSPRVKHELALAEHLNDMGRAGEAIERLSRTLSEHEHAPDFVRRRERQFVRSAESLLEHLTTNS